MQRRDGMRVVAALGIFVLASCGSGSADEATKAEPEVPAIATETTALDLTDVSFDVRRDPG